MEKRSKKKVKKRNKMKVKKRMLRWMLTRPMGQYLLTEMRLTNSGVRIMRDNHQPRAIGWGSVETLICYG